MLARSNVWRAAPRLIDQKNVLTIDVGTSRLTQGSSAQSALVEVMRWEEAAPLVRALEIPAIVKSDRAA